MNTESTANEINLRRLESALGHTTEGERTMYLALREGGDSHAEAVETVRGERLMRTSIH